MKKLLSLVLTAALVISALPLSVHAEKNAPLQVGVIADIHYFPAELTGNYCAAFMEYSLKNTRQEPQSVALLDAALAALAEHARTNGMKYLLLPGDTTRDGEYDGHRLLAERLERFERETGIQVIVTNGNHDINNGGAATFENGVKERARRTTPEDWLTLYQNLGYDLAYHTFMPTAGKKGGMLSYSVRLDGGYRLIVMDSGKYSWDNTSDGDNQHEGAGKFSDDLLAWILNETADARANGETVIGMMHHSLVPHTPIEATVMPTLILDNFLPVSEALAEDGMRYVFTGHMHQSDVAVGYSDSGESIADIATASLSGYPNTFREVLFDNTSGEFSADMQSFDADCVTPVVFAGKAYEQPYRDTFSFWQSFGHDGLANYGADMAGNVVLGYLDRIRQQGFVNLLKGMGVDLEGMLNDVLGSGLAIGNTTLFSAKNIMGFIDNLAGQIEKTYANDPERVKALLKRAIDKVAFMQVSAIPSTKFLDSPGFGNAGRGGNLEEFGMSLVTYLFNGDEDLADDAFMADVLEQCENGGFTNLLVKALVDVILNDILMDELLANLRLNLSTFFVRDIPRETVGAFLDMMLNMMLGGDNTYASLINFLCKIGVVPQKNAAKLLDGALDIYVNESGFGKSLAFWVRSLITDSNPGVRQDSNVKLTYTGPVPVVPVQGDYRRPADIDVQTGNSPAAKTITWYTKYSVTGSNIEIVPYSVNPVFTGIPSAGFQIQSNTEQVDRTFTALSLGFTGLFPYTLSQVKHTVAITGLAANKRYLYRVGDAQKGWWSETMEFNTFNGGVAVLLDSLTMGQIKILTADIQKILSCLMMLSYKS